MFKIMMTIIISIISTLDIMAKVSSKNMFYQTTLMTKNIPVDQVLNPNLLFLHHQENQHLRILPKDRKIQA